MEPNIEASLETMSLTRQQQPSSLPDAFNDDFDKLLADFPLFGDNTAGFIPTTFGSNNDIDQLNIDSLIDSSNDQTDPLTFIETQLSETSIDDDVLQLLESYGDNEQSQQSTFIEDYHPSTLYQSQSVSSSASLPIGSSPVEPKSIDNSINAQAFVDEQDRIYRTASKPKKSKTGQQRSTTVGPVDYYSQSGGCQPCTTQLQNDYAYQRQTLQCDADETKKIQIHSQPRPTFRPRTQNESRTSSHYIRCDEGIKPEYPTVLISSTWNFHSDINLIEVALMGVDKQPHPYTITNKTCSDTFEDHVLIFKQNEPNVLYFRLTNEDFLNGYKTFSIELIKSKQDNVITKELIRTRQLEHSMLRFTRIFQVGKTEFQRDEGSEEYSTVMSEAYGDVDVEHMGPRFGPMSGQEMVYIVLKGRILKSDLKIEILEDFTNWHYSVDNFTKNGNVVYFMMPAFPFPQFQTMKANIVVYYKGEELTQSPYLYKGSLDEELAELHLNDPSPTTASSSSSTATNNFNPFDFLSSTDVIATSSTRNSSTPKRTKRLNTKQK